MNKKIITPVITEPITLAEVKQHLRLTSDTFLDDISTIQCIKPGSYNVVDSYGLIGTVVDVLGMITVVNLNAGECGSDGSISARIQESDDNMGWQDFAEFKIVTTASENAVQTIEYTGGKQYIRVVATVTTSACSFGVDVITKSGDAIEDKSLEMWITAAREYCENITGRALATQTIEAYPKGFPCGNYIELPSPPLQSVNSLKYKDSDGNEITLIVDNDYIVDTDSVFGRIVLPYGKTWPSFTPYPVNPIKIQYVAGYTDDIPKTIKQAMLLLVGHWYENREAVMTGAINMTKKIEYAVDALLAMNRIRWF